MSFPKQQKGIIPLALLGLGFLVLSLTGITMVVSNPNARITINSWAKAKQKTWRDIGSPSAGRHAGKLAEEARVQIETQRAAAGITRPCQKGCTPEQIKIDGAGAGILGGNNGLGGISGFYLHDGKYYPISEEAGGPSTESLQYVNARINITEEAKEPKENVPAKVEEPITGLTVITGGLSSVLDQNTPTQVTAPPPAPAPRSQKKGCPPRSSSARTRSTNTTRRADSATGYCSQ